MDELRAHVEQTCDLDFSCGEGLFRINLRGKDGGNEHTAYYTEDSLDAFLAASEMAARREARRFVVEPFIESDHFGLLVTVDTPDIRHRWVRVFNAPKVLYVTYVRANGRWVRAAQEWI